MGASAEESEFYTWGEVDWKKMPFFTTKNDKCAARPPRSPPASTSTSSMGKIPPPEPPVEEEGTGFETPKLVEALERAEELLSGDCRNPTSKY